MLALQVSFNTVHAQLLDKSPSDLSMLQFPGATPELWSHTTQLLTGYQRGNADFGLQTHCSIVSPYLPAPRPVCKFLILQ